MVRDLSHAAGALDVDLHGARVQYQPRADIVRFLIGTPAVIALTGASAGISLTDEAGIGATSAKASALMGLAIELCDQFGLTTCTACDPARRGRSCRPFTSRLARSLVAAA